MQVILYNVLRRFLSQSSRNRLKKILYKIKNKFKRLILFYYGTVDNDELICHIESKLGNDFEILMIHSSYDNMQPMYIGNPSDFIKRLVNYCNKSRITLVMPAFFFGKGGNDIIDAANYYHKTPVIDLNKTYSQMGFLTEIFRRYPGVKRSIHPTHSVCALGPLADEVVRSHHLSNNPYGSGTPFGVMAEHKTKIFGIGTRYYRVLTQAHTAEELMGESFPIHFNYEESILINCISINGKEIKYNFAVRSKEFRIDAIALKKILDDIGIQTWKFKGIPFFVTEAKLVTDTLIHAAKKGKTIYRKIKSR